MSDGALRIPITGDASQFKATLSEVESSLKYFKEKLKSAKGDQIGKINFTISGLEETKNALTTFGKFADGTLGQLYQKLEQLKSLRLTIQADATALTPVNNAIDETTKKIKDLLSAGLQKPIVEAAQVSANSIQGLKNRIDELNQKKLNLDAKDDYLQIVKLNQEIDRLKTQINNLNKLGLKVDQTIDPAVNSFKNLTNTSNKSRQALTSLSLVAQDLPFGFIAIQNNLPAVIQTFGQLKAESRTVKGALSSLASGLVGPAGLFLAFSVVTGAVTYAIQKYGSLGAAIDALTGKYVDLGGVVNRAAESLKQYNENQISTSEITARAEASQAGQILKARTLTNVVLDLSKSEDVRKKALEGLQKLDEERFKNFNVEKGLLDGLTAATENYTRAIIAQGVASKFTDQVSATTVELENQRNALGNVLTQLDKYGNFQERLNRLAQEQAATARQGGIPRSANKEEREIQALVDKRKELEAGIVTLTTQLNEYNSSAKNAILTASSLSSGLKKTGDSADDAAKKTSKLKKAVKDLDIAELERQGRIAAFKLEEQAYKNRLKAVEDNIKAEKKLFDEIENRFEADALEADKLTKKVAPNASIERATEPLAEVQRQYQLAFTAINQTFFEPLQNLFETFLNTGKFTFKEFTKSVLKSITSIVSKLLATGVITGLMNLLNPGGMLASFAGGFGGGGQGANPILSALGNVFGAQPRRPDFNGVRPQGGGRGGEKVEFQIRGTNLVGVLNRANGEINRIG